MTAGFHKLTVEKFRALHQRGAPFVLPNPWDAGSARICSRSVMRRSHQSAGFAMTLGRRDYGVSRDEALQHAREIIDAVDIPVTADLENGFGAAPAAAAETIARAAEIGLAGGSIEDSSGDRDNPVFEEDHAASASQRRLKPRARRPTGSS